jgi:hypothetical protein
MQVHETTPVLASYDFLKSLCFSGEHYFQDTQLAFQVTVGTIRIWELENAMKPGKKCREVAALIEWGMGDEIKRNSVLNVLSCYEAKLGQLFADLYAIASPSSREAGLLEFGGQDCQVYRSERDSIRTYSPFAKLKPLAEEPKKWTVTHVVKALLANQFEKLKCRGVYTDDYAYDAEINCGKGRTLDPLKMIKELVEEPSGWWATKMAEGNGEELVHISCYHFDNNSFKFVLKPQPKEEPVLMWVAA